MDQDYLDKQLDAKIIEINNNDNVYEIGTVVNVKDFIIEVTGISNVMFYEKINIANKALGYVNSINENTVTIAVLKIDSPINVGDMVYSTNTLYQGSFSPSSFGRVIDLFGVDKLSGKKFSDLIDIPIERPTIPIMDRGTVNRPLLTGITGIDLMYPIGRGQRQLIIGDKRTGKTQIGLDTIVNQKDKNVLCFYVAIGKTKKEVKNIYSELTKKGALDYTIIITAFNDELPPVISLIPYFALSVAENYMMDGYDVLVIIDDLKRHAEAYREISLISGKTPGRDAYPADIFYTHSRLLEKGCQYKDGGSVTILPIVETKGGDITDYISTNIISITDGQIVLSSKAFQKGEKPAIDYGLSVSRLGGAVQDKEMKVIGSAVRRKLLSYLETRSVYELVNMDEMSFELKNQFMEGKIILDNMMQYKFSPRTSSEMLDMFAGIVEVEDEEEKAETQEVIEANNEVFNNTNTSIPEDGTLFENTQPISIDGYVPNSMPEEIPVELNAMPQEIPFEVNSMPEEIPFEVNAMPEEIPQEEVNNEIIIEEPVSEVVEEPVVEESIIEEPVQEEIIEETIIEEPIIEEPVVEEPVIEEEVIEEPVIEEPVVEEPIIEEPIASDVTDLTVQDVVEEITPTDPTIYDVPQLIGDNVVIDDNIDSVSAEEVYDAVALDNIEVPEQPVEEVPIEMPSEVVDTSEASHELDNVVEDNSVDLIAVMGEGLPTEEVASEIVEEVPTEEPNVTVEEVTEEVEQEQVVEEPVQEVPIENTAIIEDKGQVSAEEVFEATEVDPEHATKKVEQFVLADTVMVNPEDVIAAINEKHVDVPEAPVVEADEEEEFVNNYPELDISPISDEEVEEDVVEDNVPAELELVNNEVVVEEETPVEEKTVDVIPTEDQDGYFTPPTVVSDDGYFIPPTIVSDDTVELSEEVNTSNEVVIEDNALFDENNNVEETSDSTEVNEVVNAEVNEEVEDKQEEIVEDKKEEKPKKEEPLEGYFNPMGNISMSIATLNEEKPDYNSMTRLEEEVVVEEDSDEDDYEFYKGLIDYGKDDDTQSFDPASFMISSSISTEEEE